MKLKITLLLLLTFALAGYGWAQDKSDQAAGTAATAADKTGKTGAASKDDKDDLGFPHDGKIDDVSAIGNRNVGCNKGLGKLVFVGAAGVDG